MSRFFLYNNNRSKKLNLTRMPCDCNSSKSGSNPESSCANRDGAKTISTQTHGVSQQIWVIFVNNNVVTDITTLI